jgi:hypothetical protein
MREDQDLPDIAVRAEAKEVGRMQGRGSFAAVDRSISDRLQDVGSQFALLDEQCAKRKGRHPSNVVRERVTFSLPSLRI